MIIQALLFVLGLVGLYFGAEWLVRGAARLARAIGISALVIGLTIVALGTSAPELIVSVLASARGQGDLAVGNVVGSNISNIALILGLGALIYPIRVEMRLLRRELPVMIIAALALWILAIDGSIGRVEATGMLIAFTAYLWIVLRLAKTEPLGTETLYEEFEDDAVRSDANDTRLRDIVLIVGGLVVLSGGAHLLVESAVFFARRFGVSELVIGLTVVAVGTSLPELATSLLAAVRKEADIAVGNIIGSNVFNTLLILPAAALVNPLQVAPSLLGFELPVMLFMSGLLLPLVWTGLRLGRREGALLLVGYVIFTVVLVLRGTGRITAF
jgi:cation:H+ antiporter